jgi:hypothetical protein
MVTTSAFFRGYDDTESCAFSTQQRPQKTKKPVALEVTAVVRAAPTRRPGNSPPNFAEPPAISAIVTIRKRGRFDEALDLTPEVCAGNDGHGAAEKLPSLSAPPAPPPCAPVPELASLRVPDLAPRPASARSHDAIWRVQSHLAGHERLQAGERGRKSGISRK